MPHREIVIPFLNQDPSSLASFKGIWPTISSPIYNNPEIITCASGWSQVAHSTQTEAKFILLLEWQSLSAFHNFFFGVSEFKTFVSKIVPFVTAPAKPLLFDTKVTSFGSPGAAVPTTRVVEVVITQAGKRVTPSLLDGEAQYHDAASDEPAGSWTTFVQSMTKNPEPSRAVLSVEHGSNVPYGPAGVGEEAGEAAQGPPGPYIGIVTWSNEEARRQFDTSNANHAQLLVTLNKLGQTDVVVAEIQDQK